MKLIKFLLWTLFVWMLSGYCMERDIVDDILHDQTNFIFHNDLAIVYVGCYND